MLIATPIFKKYSVILDLVNNLVKSPDITLRVCLINGKFKSKLMELRTTQNTLLQRCQQVFVPVIVERYIGNITGTLECMPAFERKSYLLVFQALNATHEGRTYVQLINPLDNERKDQFEDGSSVTQNSTPNKANNLKPLSNQQLSPTSKDRDAEAVLDQNFQDPATKSERRWYPTPETCDDRRNQTKLSDASKTRLSNPGQSRN